MTSYGYKEPTVQGSKMHLCAKFGYSMPDYVEEIYKQRDFVFNCWEDCYISKQYKVISINIFLSQSR